MLAVLSGENRGTCLYGVTIGSDESSKQRVQVDRCVAARMPDLLSSLSELKNCCCSLAQRRPCWGLRGRSSEEFLELPTSSTLNVGQTRPEIS